MLARNKIFTLQFLAAAGRVLHPEMRQPLVPGAWNTHLRCAVFRRDARDWMPIGRRERGPEKRRRHLAGRGLVSLALLEPKLVDTFAPPICKETDAVAAAENRIELVFHLRHRQV